MDSIPKEELREYFRSLSREVTNKFEKIRASTSHPTGKGTEGEEEVAKFIETYMKNFFDVRTRRQIIDSENNRSHQCDVLLCHKNIMIQGLIDVASGYIFCESVACVIEVKSQLSYSNLKDSLAKLRDLAKLKPVHMHGDQIAVRGGRGQPKIFKAIFAYESEKGIRAIVEDVIAINEELSITGDERIDAIVLLNKGIVLQKGGMVMKDSSGNVVQPQHDYFAVHTLEDSLLTLLIWLQMLDTVIIKRLSDAAYFSYRYDVSY